MKHHTMQPGSAQWHALRRAHWPASDAPIMMDKAPNLMRRNDLLAIYATGVRPEVSPEQAMLFAEGHRVEALMRPLVEEFLGEELYPTVGTGEGEYERMSCSLDGQVMSEVIHWECKLLNDELRAALPFSGLEAAEQNDADLLPARYPIQMEHQCAVTGKSQKVLLTACEFDRAGKLVDVRACWYFPDLPLRQRILAAWHQFEKDAKAWTPPERREKVEAEVVESLPMPSASVSGALVVTSNLATFEVAMRQYIGRMIVAKPTKDQEFANADAACKRLKKLEGELEDAETRALSSIEDVGALRATIATLKDLARKTRLSTEKLVDQRKLEIKQEQVARGRKALANHVAKLEEEFGQGGPYMPPIEFGPDGIDFTKATARLSSWDSLVNAIDTELSKAKIVADEHAVRIRKNLKFLDEQAADYTTLFRDRKALVLKDPEDLQAVVKQRIAEADEEARKREEARKKREAEEAAPAPTAAPAPAYVPTGGTIFEDANVVPLHAAAAAQPAAAPAGPPEIRLGAICDSFGFTVTEAYLATLGYNATLVKGAKLYNLADVPNIARAIARAMLKKAEELDTAMKQQRKDAA